MVNALLDKDNQPLHELSIEDDWAEVELVCSHCSHSTEPKSSRTPQANKKELDEFRKDVQNRFERIDSKLDFKELIMY